MVNGFDLSHWNASVDMQTAYRGNYRFVFLKASEGVQMRDKTFGPRLLAARDAGIFTGAYHFFRGNADEATHFLETLAKEGGLKPGDLPPVLDWEVHTPNEAEHALEWLRRVEEKLHCRPLVYTSPGFIASVHPMPDEFKNYPLWVAHYGVAQPRIPKPWTKYHFWQVGENSVVPGVRGGCDFNIWNGTLEELEVFRYKRLDLCPA